MALKRLTIFLALILLGTMLAGCGGPDAAPADPTAAPATPTPLPPGATPPPAATATPVTAEVPNPQSPAGTIVVGIPSIRTAVGLNSAGAVSAYNNFGTGEALFTTEYYEAYLDLGGDPTRPWLAEDWFFNDDMTVLTITVREGVEFHDGWGEMTAEDVAWSLNDTKADVTPTSISPAAGDHGAMYDGAWRVVDTYTVEVDVAIPDPRMFGHNLGLQFQGPTIFSKSHYDERGAEAAREMIIATGPFQMDEFRRDERYTSVKWTDNHWRATPQFDRLIFQVVPETTVRNSMLRTGELDVTSADITEVSAFLAEGFEMAYWGAASHRGIFFAGNLWETEHALSGEPLEWQQTYVHRIPWIGHPDREDRPMEPARLVRTALAMTIDREGINEFILDGLGYPVHHAYFTPTDPNWDVQWEYPYDPDAAKELLAEAGFADGFAMELYNHGGDQAVIGEIGDAIAGDWEQLGIRTDVLKYQYTTFRPGVVGRTNVIPWMTNCDEGTSIPPWDWPKGLVMTSMTRGGFGCGFESPFIAQNFLEMVDEPDLEARTELANAFLDYIHHWAIEVGVIGIPSQNMYNPKSIESWPMRRANGANNYEEIVPAR